MYEVSARCRSDVATFRHSVRFKHDRNKFSAHQHYIICQYTGPGRSVSVNANDHQLLYGYFFRRRERTELAIVQFCRRNVNRPLAHRVRYVRPWDNRARQ